MRIPQNRNINAAPVSPRTVLESKYRGSRANLLLVIAFTLVNIVACLLGSESYFLFTASIPYYLVLYGMVVCGKMPAEYYDPAYIYDFYDTSILVLLAVLAIVITAVYLLCWIFSRNGKSVWLIVALVFFSIDSILMFVLFPFDFSLILDVIFHALVIFYLVTGILSAKKLKALPPEEPVADPMATMADPTPNVWDNPFGTAETPAEAPADAEAPASEEPKSEDSSDN